MPEAGRAGAEAGGCGAGAPSTTLRPSAGTCSGGCTGRVVESRVSGGTGGAGGKPSRYTGLRLTRPGKGVVSCAGAMPPVSNKGTSTGNNQRE
ncbi:hypothetical protein B0B52_07015 [Polaromonas sp. A23]|nr:hypothetical protein B0B52_07015 [Polaromonas sp. A23]